ncbi:MAG: hypothetical protein KAX40_05135 [Herpetosiphon sp.]|nr:hypothetical protein [Herpetosiphon sp.]
MPENSTPPIPPWLRFPKYPRHSIGWRMGLGEEYVNGWKTWAKTQTQTELLDYFREYQPVPHEWLDWMASMFGYELKTPAMYDGVRWLCEQGFGDFEGFKTWYESGWGETDGQSG